MKAHASTSILIFIIALHVTNALEAMKVLNIPERIIGGVIDIVQNHKNKPTQQTTFQGQNQQQTQQGSIWNPGYQTQNQNQAQYQYGNYGYPQSNTYPQGGYVNTGQVGGSGLYHQVGGTQAQSPGQYQNYPQNQAGGQFQVQNQQSSGHQSSQYQNQMQNGFQGQQAQMQVQNQPLHTQNQANGQFSNQNLQSNLNYQGSQHTNQQVGSNVPSGGYGGGQHSGGFVNHQQSGNYVSQGPPSNYVTPNQPQGHLTQTTSFMGQNHQSTQFQTGTGTYGGSQGFQTSTGHNTGVPGPTCVCQAWTKPQNDEMNDALTQRNEDKTEKPIGKLVML